MSSQNPLARLEVGNNVFELIEFTLDRHLDQGQVTCGHYGVNVAKVREVVRMPVINPLASSIPEIAGLFELRGIPIPAINLAAALGDKKAPLSSDQQVIVTEFSQKRAGFIVKATHRIRRIAWEKVLPPAADKHTCINGMTLIENNEFLFILDLEKVLLDLEQKSGIYSDPFSNPSLLSQKDLEEILPAVSKESASLLKPTILLVDDSDIILNNAKFVLEKAGFHVVAASNGQQAQKILLDSLSNEGTSITAVVSDVEMPAMDGLSLTKWIKSHTQLGSLPVILHSSLSGSTNLEAGKAVGASGYVVKNDTKALLAALAPLKV